MTINLAMRGCRRGSRPCRNAGRVCAGRLLAAALLALAVVVAGIATFSRYRVRSTLAAPAAPEKSIAVLPFENRSDDKANAYFADGIQDEILTRLSKIADLR
jgi:hypothetical protein